MSRKEDYYPRKVVIKKWKTFLVIDKVAVCIYRKL